MEEFTLKRKKMEGTATTHSFLDTKGNIVKDELKFVPTILANHIISKRDNQRVGKTETTDGKTRFFIKTVRYGYPGEVLADPINNNIAEAYGEGDSRSRIYEYKNVSEDTFQVYSRYLSTGNPLYFQNVVRRLNNGEA
jgi:hypothetical protein